MLSISGCWFIKLNNGFVFPDPEQPIINILYEWSGICDQFGLCSFMISFKISNLSIFFLLLL